jgi:hypothetical protein
MQLEGAALWPWGHNYDINKQPDKTRMIVTCFGAAVRRHRTQPIRAPHGIELRHLQLQDCVVEEQERIEGLILRRGRQFTVDSQMGQTYLDLDPAEFARMATLVELHKPANPMNAGLFCPIAIVLQANSLSNDIQQHYPMVQPC